MKGKVNLDGMESRVEALLTHIVTGITREHTFADIGAALSTLVGTALAGETQATIDKWLETFCRTTRNQVMRSSIDRAIAEARRTTTQ